VMYGYGSNGYWYSREYGADYNWYEDSFIG
jgi:hypothetical protein